MLFFLSSTNLQTSTEVRLAPGTTLALQGFNLFAPSDIVGTYQGCEQIRTVGVQGMIGLKISL